MATGQQPVRLERKPTTRWSKLMKGSARVGKVIAQASMSLDGFIADTHNQVGPLFDWYNNGDVEVTGADPGLVFYTSRASAEYLRAAWRVIGARVIGRRPFDLPNGRNGRPGVGRA